MCSHHIRQTRWLDSQKIHIYNGLAFLRSYRSKQIETWIFCFAGELARPDDLVVDDEDAAV